MQTLHKHNAKVIRAHCTGPGTEWPRSVRPHNESCSQWLRRSTEASAREADHLQTNLPDDSVLVRPTAAQKPEPCSLVKSIDMAPSRHWHPTIPENACMVSDAFPSLVSRIVAIWSPGCSLLLTDRLPLPLSDDYCIKDVRCCTRFTNNLSVSYCLAVFRCVAFQSASRAKCRVPWLAGYESKQADCTIPLDLHPMSTAVKVMISWTK